MYIFNQRPLSEQRLLGYFNKLVDDLKAANLKYKEQNDYLRAKVKKLEQDAFYFSVSTTPMKLVKENRKLKQSLRKLYEKYIKPTQTVKRYCGACDALFATDDSNEFICEPCREAIKLDVPISEQQRATQQSQSVWRKLALSPKVIKEDTTNVLFVDYENGHNYRNPHLTLVRIEGEVTKEKLSELESQQPGATRTGGSWKRILEDGNFKYVVLIDGSSFNVASKIKSPFLRYKLATGNY
jgi:hypothetical protein